MSNIDKVLGEGAIRYPTDIEAFKNQIPMLRRYTDYEIQQLYEAYSQEFCAGWLIVDPDRVDEFKQWLDS